MVIARYYPSVGGAEVQAGLLAQQLKKRGYQVSVVTMKLPQRRGYEEIDEIPVYRLTTVAHGTWASFTFMCSLLWFLVMQRRRYDIVHIHLASSPAVVGAIVGRILRKKILIKLGASRALGDVKASRRTLVGRWKLALLKRYAHFFICTNREIIEELIQEGFDAHKTGFIPNGVNVEEFSPVNEYEKIKKREALGYGAASIVTFVGRLETQKSVDVLLNAWAQVVRKIPDGMLFIIGDGSQRNYLENVSYERGMTHAVTFLGEVPRRVVREYLQISDVFVLPSVAEGLSNALLEAMSVSLPVIATNIGGNNEVVDHHKTGILVEVADIEGFTEALYTLLYDHKKAREYGSAGRKKIEDDYAIDAVALNYQKIYDELLQGTP